MKVKNISQGPRGLNTLDGAIMLDPGEERSHVRMSAAEADIAKGTGWFDLSGHAEPGQTAENDLGADAGEVEKAVAKARQEERDTAKRQAEDIARTHEAQLAEEKRKTAAAEEALTAANKARETAEAEVVRLTALVENGGQSGQSAAGDTSAPLAAIHKGGGSYAITRGDEVIRTGLSRDDAEAFNKLDDTGKTAEVAKLTAGQ